MAQPIVIKRSSVRGKVPLPTDLDLGEIALNTADGRLYLKNTTSGIISKVRNSADMMAGSIVLSASPNYTTPSWVPANGASYALGVYPKLEVLYNLTGIDWAGAPTITSPGGMPNVAITSVSWSIDGTFLTTTRSSMLPVSVYKKTGDTFTLTTVDTSPSGAYASSWSPNGSHMALGTDSPGVYIYKKDSSDVLTRLTTNVPSISGRTGYSVAYGPEGTYFAVGFQADTPGVKVYKISGDSYTEIPFPSMFGGNPGISFSPNSDYVAIVNSFNAPYIYIFKRSGDTFTQLPTPSITPSSGATSVSFSTDGTYLAVGSRGSRPLIIYKRSGDTFTKLNDPVNFVGTNVTGVSFSKDGNYLTTCFESTPFIATYSRTNDTFTKVANPSTLGPSPALCISFSPTNANIAIGFTSGSPKLMVYKPSGGSTNLTVPTYTATDSRLKYYICTGQ